MKSIISAALLVATASISLLSGCVSSSAYRVPGKNYAATDPEKVAVFYEDPKQPYQLIGRVSLVKGAAASDEAAVRKFKEVAATMGADAVIIDVMPTTLGIVTDVQGQGRAIKWQ